MFAGSRFCARCGAEAIREVLADEAPLACPRCRETMQALRLGTTIAHECAACGGLWLDPESLQRLSNASEDRSMVAVVLAGRVPMLATPPDTVRYIPCPRCQRLMNRKNFAQGSGVVLDVCSKHGIWLDRGELERLLGFVEKGGLANARARERERLVEEQRYMTARHGAQPGATSAMGATNGEGFMFHVRHTEDNAISTDSIGGFLFDVFKAALRD